MTDSGARYERLAKGHVGLRQFRSAERGAPRLLCLPFAGGQSLAFRPLAAAVPATWGVWAIDPPGHGWAAGEPLERVDAMVDAYLGNLSADWLEGTILLGHSLGGCVAFAMVEQLTEGGQPPRGLILSGTRPPHRKGEYDSFLSMDDAELLQTLIQLGGVPRAWAEEPEIFDHFKVAIRADFRAFESYEIQRPLPDIATLACGGMQDIVCRPEHLMEWTRYCQQCRVEFVAGDHMFIQNNAAAVADRLVGFVENKFDRSKPIIQES